jgi:hypothetical protein
MRQLFVLICTLLCLSGFSQKPGQHNAPWTIRGNIGIPKPISSQMYRKSFTGLYEANLSVNLRLFDNMYIGIGYQNTHMQNNKFLKQQIFNASIPYNTRLMGHGFFFKVGYDQFFSEKAYFSYSLNSGYMLCNYFNVNADTTADNRPYQSFKFNAAYFQPEVSVNMLVEGNMSFSFLLSYTTLVHRFDARSPRFNQFKEIRTASNNYLMSWINFGIGFTVLLNQKK